MHLRLTILLIIAFTFSSLSFAKSTLLTEQHFSSVQQLIKHDSAPKHTILVMDDDDTLTKMPCNSTNKCQYIGGPAWYKWQSELPSNSPYRVAKNIDGLLAVNTLVLDATYMPLTEKDIPNILKYAKQKGVNVLVATARGSDMLNATENQLKKDHILNIIASDAIRTPAGKISFAGPYMPKDGKRPVVYQNGILYLAGQNKGVMLKDFLAKTNLTHKITHIIFIDDTLKNDQQVVAAFLNDRKIDVDSIYYTYLKKHKTDFLNGKEAKALQMQANASWKKIEASLKHDLPGFDLG